MRRVRARAVAAVSGRRPDGSPRGYVTFATLCLCDRMRAIRAIVPPSFSLPLFPARGPRIYRAAGYRPRRLRKSGTFARLPRRPVPPATHGGAYRGPARTHAYPLARARTYVHVPASVCARVYVLLSGVAKLSTLSTRSRSPLHVDESAAKGRLSIPRLRDTCQDIRFVNRGAK